MADNFQTNDNILVDFDYQNVVLVDPNKTVNLDGTVQERQIHHENLVMYANLEAKMLPRTKLAVGANLLDSVQTTPVASINFLRPGGKTNLTNSYLDEITGLNSISGKGTNQPSKDNIQQENKTNDFYIKQNTLNREDTGLLGIESIRVRNTRSMTPTVEMVLIDTQGRALFEKGENSEYACFFNLPYPTFYLTLKGYYGKAIRYQLILTNFSASFEGNTGNYRINLKFYSYKYTVLAETQVGALFATPFMYSTDYRISATAAQTGAVNAALASNGNTTSLTTNVRSTKGMEKIKNVYKKYKAEGLIPQDLPELSVPELRIRLFALEGNLQKGFGQADFTPLSNINTYSTTLTKLRDDVTSNEPNSWFVRYIDQTKQFVLDTNKTSGETIFTWIFNQNIRDDVSNQKQTDAYNELRKLVTQYKVELDKNPTLGLNGNFTVDGVNYQSKISTLNDLFVAPSVKEVSIPDTFRKSLSPQDIDWVQTFQIREKRTGNDVEVAALAAKESLFFRPTFQQTDQDVLIPTYNFVFDGNYYGNPSFNSLIDKTFGEVSKQKEKLVLALSEFLAKKIEGPNGLGFKPTMRNIMGMIFASVEAFYLMMDDVHREAWSQRLNPIRKRAVFDGAKTSVTPDSKNLTQTTNGNTLASIPVYPWPLYYVETNSPDGEQFELRYPGDSKEISRTRGNNFEVWPEVQFVEEYLKGIIKSQSSQATAAPGGDQNEGSSINRISVNAVDFPMTNIPYTNYEIVKFLYEVYERVLLSVYYDRLSRPNSAQLSVYKTISDLEVSNITTALNSTSPSLVRILKNLPLTPTDILVVLRNISNDGTGPSWQQFIRGEFTSEYLRTITKDDYSILPFEYLTPTTSSTSKNVESLTNIDQYVKSSLSTTTDFTDLYPFTSEQWSAKNLANFTQKNNRYDTTLSLVLNPDKKFISNYKPFSTKENVPFINGKFSNLTQPVGTSLLDPFYLARTISSDYLITEGPITYQNKTGNLIANQTTSLLNTPMFTNALLESINLSRLSGTQYPYVKAAYMLLNSLPLGTLREKYKNIPSATDQTLDKDLDYIFATLTKFGGVHRLPYAWILIYGSIWHRYKKYIEEGVDIIDSTWTNVNTANLYDPTTSDLNTEYKFKNQKQVNFTVVGQNSVVKNSPGGTPITTTTMNVGFYPKVINDVYFMATGVDLFTGYTDSQIQLGINKGLNLDTIQKSQISAPLGFDRNNPNRVLNYNTWYSTFNFGTGSVEIKDRFKNNTTMIIPSFGSLTNQVKSECFNVTATGMTLTQEVVNNKAVQDGSVRTFWTAPNYGYFELPSITKPRYDEYLKEIYTGKTGQDAFKLGQTYTKIEEVFGTFKKEIMDSFETEFLNFSKSYFNLTLTDIGEGRTTNTNFQSLITSLLFIPEVSNQINSNDYVNQCSVSQMKNAGNTLNAFLNYYKTFRYGNPSNFNRKLFGTFTTLQVPPSNVLDKFTYNSYVPNSLPTQGGTTTYAQSYANNTAAWKAMYTYVGFATQSGMTYSNNGSYFTDFFPTMNVEFNQTNVVNFAPMIKIFGTQKLILKEQFPNDTYSKADFTDGLNNYFVEKNDSINQVLGQLFFSLQKTLPNVTEVVEKPILSAVDGNQPKLEYYEAFKSFNDKWIAGTEYTDKTLYSDVLFLDRANRDIGDKVLVDVFKLISFFSGTTSMDTRVIDFVSRIIADNQFQMMPLPAYINFWGVGDVKQGAAPNAESSESLANSLFGTFLDVDYRNSQPKLVCYYAGKPSEHLDMRDNADYRWRTDAFDLTRSSDNPIVSNLQGKTDWNISNKVVAFNVDFGTRNQGIFYSIQLDQNPAAATTEGNKVITDMAMGASGRKVSTQSVSLYNLYKNRSYECRVEALGNVMIQPTMYFNLRHVPMFRGPYMIQSVEHVIDSGNFKTYFTGTRMPVYSLPLISQQIMSINQNLLGELVESIYRLKETASTTAQTTVNIITIGNGIQSNAKYTASPSVYCNKDIAAADPSYRKFNGIDNVVTNITFADFARAINSNVSNSATKLMTFFTAYLNGHDDKTIYSYNYDLGGTPLGGLPFPQISYGGRNTYLTNQYACKSNQSGLSTPYAVFSSFENSIKFISSTYYNSQTPNNSLIYDKGKKWVNQPRETIINNMIATWILWWPTQRFQTPEEIDKWIKSNENTFDDLKKAADEALHQCEVYKLFTL